MPKVEIFALISAELIYSRKMYKNLIKYSGNQNRKLNYVFIFLLFKKKTFPKVILSFYLFYIYIYIYAIIKTSKIKV